jgi:AraC-like DNA-binding protein
MKVIQFDVPNGCYHFELDGPIDTIFHSHPAFEILWSPGGQFNLYTPVAAFEDVTFAVVPSNHLHKMAALNGSVHLLMLENRDALMQDYCATLNIPATAGAFGAADYTPAFLNVLIQQLPRDKDPMDKRVAQVLAYLEQNQLAYVDLLPTLQQVVYLSESRLSHLFKAATGVSLKKYLVWCRLKKTVEQVLVNDFDFLEALHQNGFYDQAHFTRAFKKMLGVQPSWAYNSRTVQEAGT